MPRNCIIEADQRLKELRKQGRECFYVIGDTLSKALY